MSLSIGSVTTDASGNGSGSGLSLALYQQRQSPIATKISNAGVTAPASFWSDLATQCTADATAIVNHFTANGTAKVGAAVGSLQKTPNPNNAATLTVASGADVFLPIV